MTDRVWIVFDRHSVLRLHKSNKFSVARHERYVCVDVSAPDSLFTPPPVIEASLDIAGGTAGLPSGPIVLDPQDQPAKEGGEFGQQHLNRIAAELLERSLNSTDKGLKELALNALAICREAGVEVRIAIPEVEP